MKKITLLLFFCVHLHAYSQNSTHDTYWQQQVNFQIDVALNVQYHTLDGFEKLEYINNSPDTLHFIWFHLWPNAYKNDKTAFSEQLLTNDRTDFYFSEKEKKGYINHIDFKVDGKTVRTEDHPNYIDIIKLILPQPIAPGKTIIISTPFHVQLPYNFSRGGHVKRAYQITQWYPKPAVYDHKGWHPMPYLDQGEFYSEFGNYDVNITVPKDYTVAATGDLRDSIQVGKNKSLHYLQNKVHDFAWFADKRFIVAQDTLQLPSGRVIKVASYYLPSNNNAWNNSIQYIKNAVLTRSLWVGEYPFNVVTAVEAPMGFDGGMEYPTITSISPTSSAFDLEQTIEHEVGHNWFYGILATNERRYPWMDEGMNTYYDGRYDKKFEVNKRTAKKTLFGDKIPSSPQKIGFETIADIKKDHAINTSSENFTELNYQLIAYYKASEWMKKLESLLGKEMFDSCMRTYYRLWQFKHPYPEDFKQVMESTSGQSLDTIFGLLDNTGNLPTSYKRKQTAITSFFNLNNTDRKKYISLLPAIGYNAYDGFMIGGIIHNYQLPQNRFQFLAAPLYGTKSKEPAGLARVSYSWYPNSPFYRIDAGAAIATFSYYNTIDEIQPTEYAGFTKLAPFIRFTFNNNNALSKVNKYIQLKHFFIKEEGFSYREVTTPTDTSLAANIISENRNITQLKLAIENHRKLYPYSAELNLENHKYFIRAGFTGNYYFNYANNKNGLEVRLFAGKIIYTGAKTSYKQFLTTRYQLNLSAPNGEEDYTYSNYFIGRNKFEGRGSKQIMIRDGAFKIRTDLLSDQIGKTDNWLAAVNFVTGFPDNINPLSILPIKIPIKLFADIGTYAEAWDKNSQSQRFLYDAGFQISLLNETMNIYFPVLYSSVFKDYFRSYLGGKKFWKTVTFTINIQNLYPKKILPTLNSW